MNITPIVDPSLGNSSYLVDLGDGHAMVIDPERNPSPYLLAAERHELSIRWAIETHLHADFVSGGRELVFQGAQLLAPSESQLKFGYLGLSDGDEVDPRESIVFRANNDFRTLRAGTGCKRGV